MHSPLGSFSPSVTIPYGCQTLGEEEIKAVVEVLKSPYLTQGPAIDAFEAAVSQYCDVPYAVAFCNGTAALHAACFAAGLGSGDEAITTPMTFVATSNAVLYQQATPIFADIDPHTWNIDVEDVRSKITPRTKVLLPVHFTGQPVDLTGLYALAEQHELTVIEDACHALGAQYQGKPIGHCRDMAVFSFHPVKSITTGEGGMVVTPHKALYDKLRQFRTHGISKDAARFQQFEGAPWEYEMQSLGYNYRMTDIQAAIGTVQMGKLPEFMAQRQRIADRYREAFSNHPVLGLQQTLTGITSANHLFPIWIDPAHHCRKTVFEGLLKANLRPQVHYIPVHTQPYYQTHLGTRLGDFRNAERYYEGCISLPIYPTLSQEAQDYVIHTMLRLVS